MTCHDASGAGAAPQGCGRRLPEAPPAATLDSVGVRRIRRPPHERPRHT